MDLFKRTHPITLLTIALLLSSCWTPKQVNRYVEKQYNKELPKQDRKKLPDITITSAAHPFDSSFVSKTEGKTSNMLPLIFYWQWNHINTCSLNPLIPFTNFTKTVHLQANRGLNQKLNGRKLELVVEQLPNAFGLNENTHVVWPVFYAFTWEKVSVKPEVKDLIVSYKVLQNNSVEKSGRISVKNTEKDKGLRFFQSWKSAISEYLVEYNNDVNSMSKSFVNQLIQEL
jgi:hypothetical protein